MIYLLPKCPNNTIYAFSRSSKNTNSGKNKPFQFLVAKKNSSNYSSLSISWLDLIHCKT